MSKSNKKKSDYVKIGSSGLVARNQIVSVSKGTRSISVDVGAASERVFAFSSTPDRDAAFKQLTEDLN